MRTVFCRHFKVIPVRGSSGPGTLLRAINFIAGVSGGAVPAVFYTLNRDSPERLKEFERFLYDRTEGALAWRLVNPRNWWSFATSSYSRTDLLAEYFDRVLFSKQTFGDLSKWPYLVVNATDVALGERFNFTPFQFNCIGSDLSKFPLAYAVAASAAYPVFFPTLALTNFSEKKPGEISPFRKKGRYIPLTDGGLVDNYATAVYLDLLSRGRLIGDPINDPKGIVRPPPRGFVFIQIDASAQLDPKFSDSPDSPNVLKRLERSFDVASTEQVRSSDKMLRQEIVARLEDWKKECHITIPFVYIPARLHEAADPNGVLKNIPTRWTLNDDVINALIQAGRQAIVDQSDLTNKAVSLLETSHPQSLVCHK